MSCKDILWVDAKQGHVNVPSERFMQMLKDMDNEVSQKFKVQSNTTSTKKTRSTQRAGN